MSVGQEKSTNEMSNVMPSDWETGNSPKTALGKRLLALRSKAISAGMKLLTEEEVLEEVKRRRGELEDDEANLC
jgi:hypothetical protein